MQCVFRRFSKQPGLDFRATRIYPYCNGRFTAPLSYWFALPFTNILESILRTAEIGYRGWFKKGVGQ